MDRFETLTAGYLDVSLNPEEQKELAECLRSDAVLRRRFIAQSELSGLLRSHFILHNSGGELTRRTMLAVPAVPRESDAQPDATTARIMKMIERVPLASSPLVRAARQEAARPSPQPSAFVEGAWLAWSMAVSALIVVAVGVYLLFFSGEARKQMAAMVGAAAITQISGQVEILLPYGEKKEPAREGLPLALLNGVEITGEGHALLTYWDGTTLELRSSDKARLWMSRGTSQIEREYRHRGPGKGKRVVLECGALRADIAKQPSHQPMVLITPHTDIKVLGTQLSIDASPTRTRVAVEHGTVVLAQVWGGENTVLTSGDSATAARAVEVTRATAAAH